MPTTDDLWGGRLTRLVFDPVTHVCDMSVVITLQDGDHYYSLRCDSVSELRFLNSIPEPWDYAEVTEVYVTSNPATDEKLVEITLWSEDSCLALRCTGFKLTDLS